MKYLVQSLLRQKQSWLMLMVTFFCIASASAQYDAVVAKDGSGNHLTLQAAIDAAPANRTTPYKIYIKKGKYVEKVTIPATKTFLYIIGEGINETVISWDDYSGKTGVTEIATVTVNANDCAFMNLTMENSWGRKYDGPQALALKANADRLIFKNCKLVSGQDTVMAHGNGKRQYYRNCYIDGNTDYIYGSAIAVFDSCVIFNRDRVDGSNGGVFTAASTPSGQAYGYVFRDCILPNNNGQSTYTLGRPWGNDVQPASSETKVVFLNCKMGSTIKTDRWQPWSANTNTSLITYAEYKTRFFNGSLTDLSKRLSWTKELTDTEAAPYYVNSNIFGSWNPCTNFPEACMPFTAPPISISNFRVNRTASQSTILFNICWPINGITYELHRSTDSLTNYASVNSFTSVTDTTTAFQFTDGLPASGVSYFYKLVARKTGLTTYTTDTVLKVNTSIPLNGEYKSVASGGWTNNVSAVTTISSGAVTNVTITSSPSGYTGVPTVTFTAAPTGGTTATGTAIVTGGVVTGITITNAGAAYTSAPTATFSTSGVGGNSIWQKYNSTTSAWEAVALGTAPSNIGVTIASGTTVAVNALVGINALTIENGAVLQTDGQSRNLRMNGDITNNGTFGGTNTATNKLTMELSTSSGTYTIGGSGVYNFVTLRPLTAVQNSNFIIASNLALSGGFQAWYASNTATDQGTNNVTVTINPGVTVTAAYLHSSAATNAAATFGTYTYNINGILDLSGSTSVTGLIPNATASTKTLTVNVNGLLKLGTQFRTVSTSPGASESKVVVNINNGAEIDATKTVTTFAANPNYITIVGTGMLTRAVGSTAVLFPVGTSASSYTPVTITNAGAADNFSVSLKNTFDNAVVNALQVVNKQWNITEAVAGGTNATVALSWLAGDQAPGFDPSKPVSVMHYNGTVWEQFPATVTGAGTMASPYVATVTDITGFSPFGVQNTQSVLPLHLISFNAHSVGNNTIDLEWITSNEMNTKEFVVERKIANGLFEAIGKLPAKNTSGSHNYSFTDKQPLPGTNCYRLKQADKDGTFSYSTLANAVITSAVTLNIYPNPSSGRIFISYPSAQAAEVKILKMDGTLVYRTSVSGGTISKEISVKHLAAGNYILVFQNAEKKYTAPFVKQ